MAAFRIVLYVFLGIGCLIVVCGLVGRRKWQARVDRERVRTAGIVVDHVRNPAGGAYLPMIAFLADGVKQQAIWKSTIRTGKLELGQEVEVLYDPDRPESFHLAQEEEVSPSKEIMSIGVIVIACVLGVFIYANVTTGNSPFALRPNYSRTQDSKTAQIINLNADDAFSFKSDSDYRCTLTGYSGDARSLKIPVFGGDKFITRIGRSALANQRNLSEVTVPGTIKEIAEGAFAGCVRLQTVRIHDGTETIGAMAFEGCLSLAQVSLPASLIDISDNAFPADCSATFIVEPGSLAETYCQEHGYAISRPDSDDAI